MRRQTVLALLGAALVFAAPVSSLSAEKLVGVLYRGGDYTKQLDGLREGLRGAGLTIGAHLRLEIREVKGDFRAAQESARGLERMSADVLVTFGVSLALAAQQSTSTVPIVFTTGSDPMALGLIQSVNRPGGRVTGISSFSTEATAKRLGILRELIPTLNRVVAFYEPTNPASREGIQNLRESARRLNVEVLEQQVSSAQDVRDRTETLSLGQADAFFLVNAGLVLSQGETIISKANVIGMPVMAQNIEWVAGGALAGYGADFREHGRAAARYVARILNGASPSELPVEINERHILGINLRTARALGLTIPPTLLARADEVIE